MDSGLIILRIIAGVLLIASFAYFLIKYYKRVNADEIKVELDEEIVQLKIQMDKTEEQEETKED